jgi:hypothetical protein
VRFEDWLSVGLKRTLSSITDRGSTQAPVAERQIRLNGNGGEHVMAQILQFIRPTDAFGPEALIVLGKAYDMALEALHDVGQPEVVQEVLAKRIIKAAKKGQNDPAALCAAALSAFNSDELAR